jgi:hypothetical protein
VLIINMRFRRGGDGSHAPPKFILREPGLGSVGEKFHRQPDRLAVWNAEVFELTRFHGVHEL